jgi:alanyl-tRNA synthetase
MRTRKIQGVIFDEVNKFTTTLENGYKEVLKIDKIDGKKAFDLYQTYGFPLELTEEVFIEKGQIIDKEQFKNEFESHKEKS